MINFRNIDSREATLNRHEVLTPNSLDLDFYFFRQVKFAPLYSSFKYDRRNRNFDSF